MKKVISICGKGGVGKTTVAALLSRLIVEQEKQRGLVIDADPSAGLSMALSLPVKKTVNDLRESIIAAAREHSADKLNLAASIDFQLLESLSEYKNLAFLAVGRPEEEGCYCQINSFLRESIQMLASQFDFTIIDAEAGVEQVNRRVMEDVNFLLLVSDLSAKGLNVAETIEKVAARAIGEHKAGLLINRAKNEEEVMNAQRSTSLPVIGWLPEDGMVRDYDINGKSFLDLPTTPALQAVETLMQKL
ncbi:MAG: AAA family ATPase [Firmicutes bacterium]|nr:AAA family ATPase [Bacillota bacterium]